jgi:hypothetical protein
MCSYCRGQIFPYFEAVGQNTLTGTWRLALPLPPAALYGTDWACHRWQSFVEYPIRDTRETIAASNGLVSHVDDFSARAVLDLPSTTESARAQMVSSCGSIGVVTFSSLTSATCSLLSFHAFSNSLGCKLMFVRVERDYNHGGDWGGEPHGVEE